MNKLIPTEIIENRIFIIRGQKVMIDKDLASLYEVETRVLNQAVKRNPERFPEEFMFQLTENEFKNLISQFVTSSWGGVRKLPYAFTEHGVAMLSIVLNSKRAIAINIQIIRTFNKLRSMAVEHKDLRDELIELKNAFINYAKENNLELEEIYRQLDNLNDKTKPIQIGFKT